jgi:outer membrane protein TolC
MTIDEAIDYAFKHRGELDAARQDVIVKEASNTQVNARFMPNVTGNASVNTGLAGSFQGLRLQGLSMSPYKNLIGGSVDARWDIFDFGRTVADSSAASFAIDAARHGVANLQRTVRYRVQDRYLHCLTLTAMSDLSRKHERGAEEASRIAKAHAGAGLISRGDYDLAELQHLQTQRMRMETERAELACKHNLAALIGLNNAIELVDVSDSQVQAARAPHGLEGLIETAQKRRPDIAARKAVAESFDRKVISAGLDHLPMLRAVGSLGYVMLNEKVATLLDNPHGNHHFYAVGVGLEVPIFEGGSILARMRALQAQRKAEMSLLADLKREVSAQVKTALHMWKVSTEQLQRARDEAKRAERVSNQALARYKAGLVNVHRWTMARMIAFRSQVAHQRARYGVLRAKASFEMAVGEADKSSR